MVDLNEELGCLVSLFGFSSLLLRVYLCIHSSMTAEGHVLFQPCQFHVNHCCVSEVIKLCHSIPVKSVENEKVAGSCLSEPLNEECQEPPTEDQGTIGDTVNVAEEDDVCDTTNAEEAINVETELSTSDKDVAKLTERQMKDAENTQNVPEETVDAESTQAVSVNEQGESAVDSEMVSKAEGEEEDKTEENAAESTAVKESSSVEGDDQKKRFVVFCLLEQWLSLLHWVLFLASFGALLDVKWSAFVSSYHFVISHPYLTSLPS